MGLAGQTSAANTFPKGLYLGNGQGLKIRECYTVTYIPITTNQNSLDSPLHTYADTFKIQPGGFFHKKKKKKKIR